MFDVFGVKERVAYAYRMVDGKNSKNEELDSNAPTKHCASCFLETEFLFCSKECDETYQTKMLLINYVFDDSQLINIKVL